MPFNFAFLLIEGREYLYWPFSVTKTDCIRSYHARMSEIRSKPSLCIVSNIIEVNFMFIFNFPIARRKFITVSWGNLRHRRGNFGHFLILLLYSCSKDNVNRKYTNLSFTETKRNNESMKLKCVRSYPMLPVFNSLYSDSIHTFTEKNDTLFV